MTLAEVRLLNVNDLPKAERASDVIFLDGDRRDRRVSEPEPEPRSEAGAKRWIDRMRYFLDGGPEGCWVAVEDEDVVGFAISQNRDRLWYLATYGVLPDRQGQGIGRRLMDAALPPAGGGPGFSPSLSHPGAPRRYWLAVFSLHPRMRMVCTVDRSPLPAVT